MAVKRTWIIKIKNKWHDNNDDDGDNVWQRIKTIYLKDYMFTLAMKTKGNGTQKMKMTIICNQSKNFTPFVRIKCKKKI